MSILKDLNELVSAQVISAETSTKIQGYYKNNQQNNPSRL